MRDLTDAVHKQLAAEFIHALKDDFVQKLANDIAAKVTRKYIEDIVRGMPTPTPTPVPLAR